MVSNEGTLDTVKILLVIHTGRSEVLSVALLKGNEGMILSYHN